METSDFKVTVVIIDDILDHLDADRLEIAFVGGWNCVVKKGSFKKGDAAIYFPIDSVLREDTEARIFGPDSKVGLTNHRVKTIKLRGAVSQGLLVPLSVFPMFNSSMVGVDLTELVGVKKYEPKAPGFQVKVTAEKKYVHPDFHVYTKWGNINNNKNLFKPDDIVVVTEKIHGTNFRAGWLPYTPKGFFTKILKFFRLTPKWEFVYGSHNTQLSNKDLEKKDGKNIYANMVNQYDLMNRLPMGTVVYGEIFGDGIQKNFSYGLKDKHDLVIFDIKVNREYVDWGKFEFFIDAFRLPMAPVLYKGTFRYLFIDRVINGPSEICKEQKIKEGVVIKTVKEERCHVGRKGAKVINPEYLLLKGNTDFH